METFLTASWSSGDHEYVLFHPFMLFSAFNIEAAGIDENRKVIIK